MIQDIQTSIYCSQIFELVKLFGIVQIAQEVFVKQSIHIFIELVDSFVNLFAGLS